MYSAAYESPLGILLLTCSQEGLAGVWMGQRVPEKGQEDHPILSKARLWLDGYFRGENPEVDFPLMPGGTDFQRKVWELLLQIPYGQTRTYGEIAREMAALTGKERMSAQAVGQAVGKNPISILIPCHRVVGADGKLTGYAGGLDKKVWLLGHEGWQIKENRVV